MKTREEVTAFILQQLHTGVAPRPEKGKCWHYGKQELRQLLNYIYGNLKNGESSLREIDLSKSYEQEVNLLDFSPVSDTRHIHMCVSISNKLPHHSKLDCYCYEPERKLECVHCWSKRFNYLNDDHLGLVPIVKR